MPITNQDELDRAKGLLELFTATLVELSIICGMLVLRRANIIEGNCFIAVTALNPR